MHLPIRFLPSPGDTLDVYLIHLAEANSVAPVDIIDKFGLPRSCRTKRCDLRALADAAGGNAQDVDILVASARWLNPESGLTNLCGMSLHSSILGRSVGRACPACLSSGVLHSWQWELKAITACPTHGCLLIDQCPACSRRLNFNRPGISLCHCGASLVGPVKEAPRDAVKLAHVLSELAARRMDGPPLDTAAKLIWFAALWNPSSPSARGTATRRLSVEASWALVQRSASVLFDWPTGFGKWLTAQQVATSGTSSIHAHVPALQYLRWALRGVDETRVIEAASEYLGREEQLPTIKDTSVFGGRGSPEKLTINSAAKFLDVHTSTISRLIKLRTIPAIEIQTGKRRMVTILKRDLMALNHDRGGSISAGALAKALGVTQRCLRLLVRSGIPIREDGPSVFKRGFPATILESFEDELQQVMRRDTCPEDCLSIIRMPRLPGRSLPVILGAVLTRRLNAWWGGESHRPLLDRVLVARSALLSFGEEGMTVREAARILRVSTRLITELSGRGMLGGLTSPRADRNITREDLIKFSSKYVTTGALARRLGTSSRTVLVLLASVGVKPVITSDVERGISSVWRISEVEGLTRSEVEALVKKSL